MGLKDRLRETAAQATGGLAKGQAKVEELRTKQSLNGPLQTLGQAYWVEHSGRATPAQLKVLLEAIAPSILEAEAELGPLPFPPMPQAKTGQSAAAAPAPAAAPPKTTPPQPSDLMPDLTPPGPGEAIAPLAPNPSSVPTSIPPEAPPADY